MMDAGARVEGRVKSLRPGGDPWQRVMMEVIVGPAAEAPVDAAKAAAPAVKKEEEVC